MRITAVSVQDFKRLSHVEITPDADRALVLIGGSNGNGKSSLLDALTAAFGGKRVLPPDPVRHGADEASIHVRLGDGPAGDLEIRRVIRPDGESVLEVRDHHGPVKSPQAVLDRIIGTRFLDPLAFLRLAPKEQRAALMRVIPGAERIAKIDASRERVFTQRTEVGRDLAKVKGELARLPASRPIPEPIDVAALNEEARKLAAQQRAGQDLEARAAEAMRAVRQAEANLTAANAEEQRVRHEIARMQERLADLGRVVEQRTQEVADGAAQAASARDQRDAAAAAWRATEPRRQQVDADLRRAGEHNRAVYAAEAEAKRRAQVAADAARLQQQADELTAAVADHDRAKAEILAEAALPVEGLAIAEAGLMLGGVPFEQASDAQRWRTALAIAAAASPDLDDIWIRNGNDLDEDSLAMVEQHAAATRRRLWVERAGRRDPGIIEIRDGRVVGGQP